MPKCGSENPDSKKFCRECGTKLTRICPQCGPEKLRAEQTYDIMDRVYEILIHKVYDFDGTVNGER